MVFPAIAMAAGGAAASLGGLFEQSPPNIDQSYFYNVDLSNDPLNVALAFDAMMQLGNLQGAESLLRQSSPLNAYIERIRRSPVNLEQQNSAIAMGRFLWEHGRPPTVEDVRAAGSQSPEADLASWNRGFEMARGYGGITPEMMSTLNPNTRRAFETRVQEQIKTAAGTRTGEARASAQRQLADRVLGMEGGGPGSFEAFSEIAGNTFRGNLQDTYDRQRRDALARANAGGYNPAGILGDLDKEFMRQSASAPLQANQLAATLAANEDRDFNNLLGFLLSGSQTAQQSAQVTNQAALGSAGIAANQFQAASSARAGAQQPNKTGSVLEGLGSTVQLAGLLSSNSGPGSGGGRTPITQTPASTASSDAWEKFLLG